MKSKCACAEINEALFAAESNTAELAVGARLRSGKPDFVTIGAPCQALEADERFADDLFVTRRIDGGDRAAIIASVGVVYEGYEFAVGRKRKWLAQPGVS